MPHSYLPKKATTVLISGLFSSALFAANPNSVNENFAETQGDSSQIYWTIHPSIKYESIKLTVTLPDGNQQEESSEWEPSLNGPLEDGGYDYELVVTPSLSSEIKNTLQATRNTAERQDTGAAFVRNLRSQGFLPQQPQIQSGHFTLLNGQLVPADQTEEQ